MTFQSGFSQIAAVLADPAREAMLTALMNGHALPAGELAAIAGVSPPGATAHLRKLVEGGFVSVWQQGRHRYYRLADDHVAQVIEALVVRTMKRPLTSRARRPSPDLCFARCCYGHLAGRLGVALAGALEANGYVSIGQEQVSVTDRGRDWLAKTGITSDPSKRASEKLRLCLDWTERQPHLAGPLADAICRHLREAGFLRNGQSRALQPTPAGRVWFRDLGISDDGEIECSSPVSVATR